MYAGIRTCVAGNELGVFFVDVDVVLVAVVVLSAFFSPACIRVFMGPVCWAAQCLVPTVWAPPQP